MVWTERAAAAVSGVNMCMFHLYKRDYILNIFIFINILLMSNATEVKAQWIESVDFVFIKKKKNTISLFFFLLSPTKHEERGRGVCVFVI